MVANYLKIALRYLNRHRGYSLINIFGLAVGITPCVLIMMFVRSEWSYDSFHANAKNLYRVWQREKADGQEFLNTVTPIPAGPAIHAFIPEAVAFCRVYNFNTMLGTDTRTFNESIDMVDTSFFTMFSFPLEKGDSRVALSTPNSIVITPEMAKKYFGKGEPLGKGILVQLGDEKLPFIVSGIVVRAPEESSIKFDFLISFESAKKIFNARLFHNWFNVFNETYLQLRGHARPGPVEYKFQSLLKQQLGKNYGKEDFDMYLQPITDIHLNKNLPAGNLPISDPKDSYILGTIGVLILLVACINFITLSVGRSTTRAMEVGVRKTLGAERQQLMRQFWGEALLMTLLAFMTGLALSIALVGPFDQLIRRNLSLQADPFFILFCMLLVIVIAVTAGVYPAIVLSGFSPVSVLKGKMRAGNAGAGLLGKALIIGQFATSIVMIVATIVISRQMHYLLHKDLGYDKGQVVVISTNKPRLEGYKLARLYNTGRC